MVTCAVIVVGRHVVEEYLSAKAGTKGSAAARRSFVAWEAIVLAAEWKKPTDVKKAHPKASILKSGRAVFNIKGNDFRLVASIDYAAGFVAIKFFGTHAEYDRIDTETV